MHDSKAGNQRPPSSRHGTRIAFQIERRCGMDPRANPDFKEVERAVYAVAATCSDEVRSRAPHSFRHR